MIVTAILAVILVCSLVLSACVSANYSKTKKSLEKKGYTVQGTEDADELDDDISWVLSGIKGTDYDTVVYVYCFKSISKAKDAIKKYTEESRTTLKRTTKRATTITATTEPAKLLYLVRNLL